ncbi:MAG: ChbG/HpnK family deacetylase [Acidimicrobiales bacterium]
MSDVKLVVQADDFGMCHAVNQGIVTAFNEGIVTQATAMPPTPWFAEAAALASRHDIPCGVHLTLTCEWENLRWGPLTPGASLCGDDGTLRRTVADVMEHVDRDEAVIETTAQVERFRRSFGSPIHLDPHMGAVPRSVVERTCAATSTPFLYPIGSATHDFTSITFVSAEGGADKTAWLVAQIEQLAPGIHLFCTHPALPTEELAAITSPDADDASWAVPYRASDLDALCSTEVRRAVEARGVELVAVPVP